MIYLNEKKDFTETGLPDGKDEGLDSRIAKVSSHIQRSENQERHIIFSAAIRSDLGNHYWAAANSDSFCVLI